jgi:hypothetical protein
LQDRSHSAHRQQTALMLAQEYVAVDADSGDEAVAGKQAGIV